MTALKVVNELGADKPLAFIKLTDLDKMVSRLKEAGLSNGTVNRRLAAFSTIQTFCQRRGLIKAKIHVPFQKESTGRLEFFSDTEVFHILDAARNTSTHSFYILLRILSETGCRLGEALKLTGWDFDRSRKELTFKDTKNSSNRVIPISDDLAQRLCNNDYAAIREITAASAQHQWKKLRASLGKQDDPKYVMHTFRHTVASRMAQAGVPINVIKECLGHKSINVTLRYAHLDTTSVKSAFDAIKGK